MKFEQFELTLENGEKVTCSKAGQGKRIAFICGPGSFYLKALSALEEQYTFFTSDSIWTYKSSESLPGKDIASLTKENIKERDHLVVKAIKKHFLIEKMDGFGFSAPGALLFEEALDHPEDFDKIIGTGIGLIELDPTFSKTNALFNSMADSARKIAFNDYQEKYKTFQTEVSAGYFTDSNLFNFFNVKPTTQLPLKPHKQFIAETLAMIPKIFFDYTNVEQNKAALVEHWRHNLAGEHMDKRMQEHFFIHIYPKLCPLESLMKLAEAKQPILLVYGDADFITPLPKITADQLEKLPSVSLITIPDCGHLSYKERPREYVAAITNFVESEHMTLALHN